MLVRELAMFFGGRCMVLGLIVLAARVVMLSLMVVMRRRMVVAGCGVMMLLRRVFCHLSALPLLRIGSDRKSIGRQLPLIANEASIAQFALFGNGSRKLRGQNAGRQAATSIPRRRRDETRTSVSGANAAPALSCALTTNVSVL